MTSEQSKLTVSDAEEKLAALRTAVNAIENGNDFPGRDVFLKNHIGLQIIFRIRASQDSVQTVISLQNAQRPLLVEGLNKELVNLVMTDSRFVGYCMVVEDARRWRKKRPAFNFELYQSDMDTAYDRIRLALSAYEDARLPGDPEKGKMAEFAAEETTNSYNANEKIMRKLTGFGPQRDLLLQNVVQQTLKTVNAAMDLLGFDLALQSLMLEIQPGRTQKKSLKKIFEEKDIVLLTLERLIENAHAIETDLTDRRQKLFVLDTGSSASLTIN